MPSISQKVRNALVVQLSDPVQGFNARLAVAARSYGTDVWAIDWTDTSLNFLFGRVDPRSIDKAGSMSYPLTTIDTQRSQHNNMVKFATFAGIVVAVIDVHHSWPNSEPIADFASYVDATEDAMVDTLNDQEYQTWPGNLLWNGLASMNRGNVVMGAEHWLQTLTFICQFNLVTL